MISVVISRVLRQFSLILRLWTVVIFLVLVSAQETEHQNQTEHVYRLPLFSSLNVSWLFSDEYAYRIPNPEHAPKYTKAKVMRTQDKQHTS